MKRFFRKALIWGARITAVIIILLVLFYAEEDWRGARAWGACQRDLAAKGEILDLRKLFPPGKPEDDLSKTAIFAPLYDDATSMSAPIDQVKIDLAYSDTTNHPKGSNYLKGEHINLAAWQKYYRTVPAAHLTDTGRTPAQDVLQVLSRFNPQMAEIDKALGDPDAYWPINYDRPFESHLGGMVGVAFEVKDAGTV